MGWLTLGLSENVVLRESMLRHQLFGYLVNYHSNDLIVEMWKGWWIKPGDQKQQYLFFREFDIARFEKTQYGMVLTGYEIKGMQKKGTKVSFPPFGAGLDQALCLLMQGADYSYLVTPEPSNEEAKTALATLCDRFTNVGLMFPAVDGERREIVGWQTRIKAKQNSNTSENLKKNMLTFLMASGQRGRMIHAPSWTKELMK